MIGAKDRYIELVTELLLQRALADDQLPEDDEARYADELDRCWWAMSRSEQDEVERAIADQPSLTAPVELGESDTEVRRGAKEPPRKKLQAA
jgi:hypothetical protein